MFNFMGLINGTAAIQTNVSCTCNCKRSTSFQSMEITQLEFVQILVIVVVMMVMVVVITCLLNHYRLSARSFISRHNQARRRHLPMASDGSLWSSDGPGPSSGMSEQQVYTPRPPERVPSYLQRDRLARFQPTYPYLPHAVINLPPTISLSDGEEPPPYQGLCTLQLRDPEQQLELNRGVGARTPQPHRLRQPPPRHLPLPAAQPQPGDQHHYGSNTRPGLLQPCGRGTPDVQRGDRALLPPVFDAQAPPPDF
ncbi:hypothetical protein UPYG_G00177030 [Umbra pygmaea]|uniref:Prostate transmembrane protein, androgen induced 1 n=1 Tax=Umbra pygmaea TaxID=75934 RepID=A0ABD0WUR9_UMBPY